MAAGSTPARRDMIAHLRPVRPLGARPPGGRAARRSRRYGCAKPERDLGPPGADPRHRREARRRPRPRRTWRSWAATCFTPEIFDSSSSVEPGVGGEIQLTDAIALLLADQAVYGVTFDGRPLRHRQGARPTSRPSSSWPSSATRPRPRASARFLADLVPARGPRSDVIAVPVIPLRRGPRATSLAAARPLGPAAGRRSTTPSAACWPSRSWPPSRCPPFANSAMDGFAVRAADVAGATEAAPVAPARWSAPSPPAPPPTSTVGPGRRCGS